MKFGLGLSQLIGPSRSDERHATAGHNPMSPDGSPPPSPYPGRRAPLPHIIEAELRTACLAVCTNQTPSHMIAPPPPPLDTSKAVPVKAQLDYAAIKKSLDKPTDVDIQRPNRRSTRTFDDSSSEMAELQAAIDSTKYSYKPETAVADLFAGGKGTTDPLQINSAMAIRRREELLAADHGHRRTKSGQASQPPLPKVSTSSSLPPDRPRASHRTASQGTSGSTPQTDVTEYPWCTSTAPTSAGITPARNSKRASAHLQLDQEGAAKTDATPVEWMRSELDRRRKQFTARSRRPSEHERPDARPASRAPSRARSIRSMKSVRSIKSITASITDNVKEYIRPGSSKGPSRAASVSRSRARHTAAASKSMDQDRQERGPTTRPPPRRDWRNWGRSHRDDSNGDSSGEVSRSSSTRGRSEVRKAPSAKKEINLNRELPPLPSLDQWDEQTPSKPAHVANMKSPTSRVKPPFSPPYRSAQPTVTAVKPSISEKDEIVATRLGSPVTAKPDVYKPTHPRKPVGSGAKPRTYDATGVARTTDTDREMRDAGLRIQFSIEELMPSYGDAATPAHSHSQSMSSMNTMDTKSRLRADPQFLQQAHSRSASSVSHSVSMHTTRSQTLSDVSKSSSSLPATSHSFSRHRKYDKSDIPPALNSNVANQGRKVASKAGNDASDPRYRHVAEISAGKTPPPPPPQKDEKKAWWHVKGKQKKQMTWMDQLEKLGIKDGVLLNDETAGSPVVRY